MRSEGNAARALPLSTRVGLSSGSSGSVDMVVGVVWPRTSSVASGEMGRSEGYYGPLGKVARVQI